MATRLGKYHLRRRLGAGAMGEVWEAVDTVLDRPVAVKLLFESGDEKDYVREAAAAARVNHPNAVAVYDAAEVEGRWFIVMELVAGPNAGRLVSERGRLPWAEATRIARDAAAGLGAVHAAGLVHRDVKPGNVLIAPDGTAKVADFGVAKRAARSGLTTVTGVVGTPHYMCPEQCWGELADARADVYSLGATYYTLLTARPPYDGATEMAVMYAHCNSPVPDPRGAFPDLPDGCAAVVRRAMAKLPAERFASADEMRAALDAVLAGAVLAPVESAKSLRLPPRTIARDPIRRRAITRRAALTVIPVAVAGIAAAVQCRRTPPSTPATNNPTTPDDEPPTWVDLPPMPGQVQQFVIAPDGRTVAVAVTAKGDDDSKDGVYLLRPDGRPVPGWPKLGRGAEAVAFSPDGKLLAAAFRIWETVRVWEIEAGRDVSPGSPQRIPAACAVAFSTDGQRLAAGSYTHDGARVLVWQWDGDRWRQTCDFSATERSITGFTFVPRTEWLAVMTADGEKEEARAAFRVFDTTTGKPVSGPEVVVKRVWLGPTVAVAVNAPLLAVSSLGAVRLFAVPDWKPVGDPMPVGDTDKKPQEPSALALSPDGSRLAAGFHNTLLVWRTADGTTTRQPARHHGQINALAFTPDGNTLLCGAEDGTLRAYDPSSGTPH